jgi:hypothetical protein
MPADQNEFVDYVDTNEREVLQRYGLRSAGDLFIEAADRPRLIVMYRDQRQRRPTEFVALEEAKVGQGTMKRAVNDGPKSGSKWVAADRLGIGQEISADEANRVMADAEATIQKPAASSEPKESNSGSKDSSDRS